MPKSWLDSSRTGRGWLLGCLPRRSPGARTGFKLIIAFSDCWTIGRLGRLIGQLVYCHYYSAAQLAARPGPRPSADGAVISRLPPPATVQVAPAGHCLPLRLAQAPPGIPGRTQCADRGWPEAPSLQVPRGRARYSKRRRGRNAGVQTNWPWQWDGPQRLISPGRGQILRETRGFPTLMQSNFPAGRPRCPRGSLLSNVSPRGSGLCCGGGPPGVLCCALCAVPHHAVESILPLEVSPVMSVCQVDNPGIPLAFQPAVSCRCQPT